MSKFMVAYAKIAVDKDDGVALAGVYFGGLSDTHDGAVVIARECVNTLRGGAIIPKIAEIVDDDQLVEALYDATEKFERIAANMTESNNAINKKKKR